MKLLEVAADAAAVFRRQGRLIRLRSDRTTVFVGDTHGDIDATRSVLSRYLGPGQTIVFLGDAVDRGADSAGNLELILHAKLDHPETVYLLMGNHEAWSTASFTPADFWNRLAEDEACLLAKSLSHLPFAAAHPSGLLSLHGALPDLPSLDEIESVKLGSVPWRAMTWGDFDDGSASDPPASLTGRPTFAKADFEARSARLGIRFLVRSHQPFAPTYLYGDRCLTIFTSNAYGDGPRQVALLRAETTIRTTRDLELEPVG